MPRDEITDISRGIGILLVIAGHIPLYAIQVNLIYFFHMPLFFYLSGVTHKKQEPLSSLTAGTRLAANYLIYGLAFSLIGWLWFGQNLSENLLHLISLKPAAIWEIPGFGVYWFIVALVILKILCASEFIYKSWLFGIALFLVIPFINETIGPDSVLTLLGPALLGLFFFQMGQFQIAALQWIRPKATLILLLSAILYFGLSIYSIAAFNGWQHKLVNFAHLHIFNPFLALLLSISGIVSTLAGSIFFASFSYLRNILSFYGRYSFILFVIHLLFIQLLSSVIPQSYWHNHLMLSRIAVLIITLVACTVLALFISFLPKRRSRIRKLLLMQ